MLHPQHSPNREIRVKFFGTNSDETTFSISICTVRYRPTQSMIYVHLLVNRFQKSILLIVQYKSLKSCSGDFILKNLTPRTRLCGTGFITQHSWILHFCPTKMVGRKCFVPLRYQLRRGMSGGTALEYFCMIYTVGRSRHPRFSIWWISKVQQIQW